MSQNYYPSSQTLPNSTMAIVSLVSGILGLTFLPVIGSIIALITGYMAKKEINENLGTLAGAGMATGGIVLGWIGVGLLCLFACLFGAMLLFILLLIPLSASTIEYNTIILPLITLFL